MKSKMNKYLKYIVLISIILLVFQVYMHDVKTAILDVSFRLIASGLIGFVLGRLYLLSVKKEKFFKFWFILYMIMSIGAIIFYWLF
jgi:hypothetical protein